MKIGVLIISLCAISACSLLVGITINRSFRQIFPDDDCRDDDDGDDDDGIRCAGERRRHRWQQRQSSSSSSRMMGRGGHHQFDAMHHRLYAMAVEERNNETSSSVASSGGGGSSSSNSRRRRREYTLDAVPKSYGGLHDDDRTLLGKVYRNASSVFEFGLGESTLIASYVAVPRYSGVDSDPNWVNAAREESLLNSSHFHFEFADIGPTKSWGHPINNDNPKIPYSYQSGPLYGEMMPFDVYMVDGRYRVACFCSSMLHAIDRGGDMSRTLFGMHDWGRREYDAVLEVGDIVEKSSLLAIFRMKPTSTESDIVRIWEEHVWQQK